MTCVLHGGEKSVLLKDKFMQEIERDPAFKLDDIHDLTKDQVSTLLLKTGNYLIFGLITEVALD
jgi:acyl-CoA oxidase